MKNAVSLRKDRRPAAGTRPLLAGACCSLLLFAHCAAGDAERFPPDFDVPAAIHGGAGGGRAMAERDSLHRFPVILIPDIARDHRDWTGANPGNAFPQDPADVHAALTNAGFLPIEIWMPDFAPAGAQMSSIEEATDDLKFFMIAVLRYTGANKVQILAHGTGCVLARLTLLKYRIPHWVHAEAYVAGPFHGADPAGSAGIRPALAGRPNAIWLTPGSELLREILLSGETPRSRNPADGRYFRLKTLTIRNGMPGGDAWFTANPDSPALAGADNRLLPGLDHDALRCAPESMAAVIPFLSGAAAPYSMAEDFDQDGFRGSVFGGPDLDDSDPDIHPGAREIRGDGIDQDCNGCDLSVLGGRDGEIPLTHD